MKRRDVVKGMIVGLALLGGGVVAQQSPAAHAADPRISVSAEHRWIAVSGYNFSTSGRPVSLDAYGLSGGSKVFLTAAAVTPLTKSFDFDPPPAPPCLLGPLCYAGGFSVPNMRQAHDPCASGGFSRIEVDAYTDNAHGNSYLAASARATVTCPPPFKG